MNKIIHTWMCGDKAFEILDSLFGQFSDGYWENSSRMEGAWRFAHLLKARDNEVLVEVDTETMYDQHGYKNPYYNMVDSDVLKYLAKHLKAIVKIEIADTNSVWSRSNSHVLSYLGHNNSISVIDAYLTYEKLLNRNIDGKYFQEVIDAVISHPISDVEINAKKEKNAKIDAIMADYHSKIENLEYMKKMALDQVEREFQQKVSSITA